MDDFSNQQAQASKERSLRVIEHSKMFAIAKQIVDNTFVTVKVEVNKNDVVTVQTVRDMILATVNSVTNTTEQMDVLYMLLANTYTDNDIIIEIVDSAGSGVSAEYRNTKPIQSIKI